MSSKIVVTTKHRLNVSRSLIASFSDPATTYYMFASDHLGETHTVNQPFDSVRTTQIDAYRKMLFGKKIDSGKVSMVIQRHDYVSGRIYAAYDDADDGLFTDANPFYVTTSDGTNWHVFKCLENNNGSLSTVAPAFADFTGSTTVFYPNDGYRWKLMYSISQADFNTWATADYIPVYDTYGTYAPGTIDVVAVEDPGRGYNNWYNGTFSTGDVKLNGNTLTYALGADASSNSGFYNGCYLYIASGNGAGQYELISNYVVNTSTKYVVLQNGFGITPQNNWTYEINPAVSIVGDGQQTVQAAARAIVNAAGNTIQRVEMLNRGAGYSFTQGSVVAASIVGVTANASVRPIYSPQGGHAYHPPSELGVIGVEVYNQFANSESNTIFTQNDYAQIGLLKNPAFANVTLSFSSQDGKFIVGETVKKLNPIKLSGTASINTTSAVVMISGGEPQNIAVGTEIYLTVSTNHQLTNVVGSNSSSITISSNGFFTNAAASLYLANTSSTSQVVSNPTLSSQFTQAVGPVQVSDVLVGQQSGSLATVSGVTINGLIKGFDTFTQTFIYEGPQLNSQFMQDELVYQGSSDSANASYVCSANVAGVHRSYVTDQTGNFVVGQNMIGQESGAIAAVLTKYVPDLVFGSGDVLYLENQDLITRANTQSETFRIVLNF